MKKIINFLLILITVSMLIGTVAAAGLFAFLSKRRALSIDSELLNIPRENSVTQLYYYDTADTSPRLLTEHLSSSSSKYRYTPLSRVPQSMIDAFISIEDKRFYSHNGVDFLRSAKAIFNYIFKKSSSFGASTITQQVVKNLTGEDERTPRRKINEMFYALNLEKKHTKEEILEIYLNIINLSNGCIGVGAASEYYFSKPVHKLSLCEAATIAAITNNPSRYNPVTHPENVTYRRNIVLDCMCDLGYISKEQCQSAKGQELVLKIKKTEGENRSSWFTETVISDLTQKYMEMGYSKAYAYSKIFHGGLKIYTTVNPQIQNIAEAYYENLTTKLTASKEAPQSAIIIMNPYNGDILGIAGAVGKKKGELVQNYATDTKRPPGSAIKPLSVYAPLIESGEINWATVIEDSPVTTISGREWPQNANRKYQGSISICDAIANSTNTSAVKLLYKLGANNSLSFLKDKLKIKSLVSPSSGASNDANAVSLALGQTLTGITLRELVSAYSIFEDGIMCTPRTFYKVTDADGDIIFDNRTRGERVISEASAQIMTKLLEEVVIRGTASGKISLASHVSVAGKTGTTEGNCDRLFVGYTPSLLAGVWCGYDYPESIDYALKNPSVTIWDEIMSEIYCLDDFKNTPKEFKYSSDIQRMTYNKNTGGLASHNDLTEELREGWFNTNYPITSSNTIE